MQPVKHAGSNVVYRGNGDNIGDLWVQRIEPGRIEILYEPTDDERQMLADGGRVVLGIWNEPMPPVSVRAAHKDMYQDIEEHDFHIVKNDG
jgi:hypothetical protein